MDLVDLNTFRSVEELRAHQREVRGRIAELNNEYTGLPFPDEAKEEFGGLIERDKDASALITELEERSRVVERLAGNERNVERPHSSAPSQINRHSEGDIYDVSTIRSNLSDPSGSKREWRDRAMRSAETSSFRGDIDKAKAQERVGELLDVWDSDDSAIARRVLLTGAPAYRSAFTKVLQDQMQGAPVGASLSNDERRAMELVRTALGLTGAQGGFAVPYTLDPTVIPTSNLSVNPYRAISRVIPITGNQWLGVTSAGVTATYSAEAAEAVDGSPTFAQPTYNVKRATCFVPASIEITQDWGALQGELAKLIQDAKDDNEATQFSTGLGTTVFPQGVLVGATTTVNTAVTTALSASDLYTMEQALPPRFRARASIVANRFIYNKVRAFDTGGGGGLWTFIGQGLTSNVPRGGSIGVELMGYPAFECSAFPATLATTTNLIAVGDYSYYIIVDRIGMDIEVIPHLFGASNRFPTGQRGFYAYWRNTARVADPNAFVVLKGL